MTMTSERWARTDELFHQALGLSAREQADLLAAAYASHGDTKHVLLLPSTPRECFDFAADALDLADVALSSPGCLFVTGATLAKGEPHGALEVTSGLREA